MRQRFEHVGVIAAVLGLAAVLLAARADGVEQGGRAQRGGGSAAARIDRPGTHTQSLLHARRERQYLVHVPARYRQGSPAPVVIMLHGGGGGMRQAAEPDTYRIVPKSEVVGFIAVFPNGISPLRSGLLATWNAGACCGRARDENVDDVGFIRAMLERLRSQLAVDPARIYAIGMSNGGLMAYRLACEVPS